MAYPFVSRTSANVCWAIRDFMSGHTDPKMLYSDGGPEIVSAGKQLGISMYGGEPGRSTTHSRAERRIRIVKDTCRALLLQNGLPLSKWSWVVQSACISLNLMFTGDEGDSPYYTRFRRLIPKEHWSSPFGSLIYCMPPKTRSLDLHTFAPRYVPCVNVGPLTLAGGHIGSAVRALPLEVFVRSQGTHPRTLQVAYQGLASF
eukprot:6487155-Amphidinium_carterae.1